MSRSPNRLLASLTPNEYRRIAPALHTTHLVHGSTLPGCGVGRVYFPGTGACSILRRMADATTIEMASVGSEGLVGLPALGSEVSAATYLQVSYGSSHYLALSVFEALFSDSELGSAIDQFCGMFTRSVMQLVACSRLHRAEARCARWLLLTYHRLGRAQFEMTQPFLAMAAGITTEELSYIMVRLSEQGVVKHDAARITVVDPIGLRQQACSCYGVLKQMLSEPVHAHRSEGSDGNVLHMRPATVCTLCGLTRNFPHGTHRDCLRAIDEEIHSHIDRARELTWHRGLIAAESMEKFEKLTRRRS